MATVCRRLLAIELHRRKDARRLWRAVPILALLGDGREVASAGYLFAFFGTSWWLTWGLGPPLGSILLRRPCRIPFSCLSCDSFYFGYFSSSGYFQQRPDRARVSTRLCPALWRRFISWGLGCLAVNLDRCCPTLQLVFSSAFNPGPAAVGGFAGATVRWPFKNGRAWVFSNRSGRISAHCSCGSSDQGTSRTGLDSMTGPSVDTLIIANWPDRSSDLITGVWD